MRTSEIDRAVDGVGKFLRGEEVISRQNSAEITHYICNAQSNQSAIKEIARSIDRSDWKVKPVFGLALKYLLRFLLIEVLSLEETGQDLLAIQNSNL